MYAVLVPDTVWVDEPVFLVCRTHTGNYMHALVDDYLGALRLARPPLRTITCVRTMGVASKPVAVPMAVAMAV